MTHFKLTMDFNTGNKRFKLSQDIPPKSEENVVIGNVGRNNLVTEAVNDDIIQWKEGSNIARINRIYPKETDNKDKSPIFHGKTIDAPPFELLIDVKGNKPVVELYNIEYDPIGGREPITIDPLIRVDPPPGGGA